MIELLFQFLLATTVGLGAWAILRVCLDHFSTDRRRIKHRLNGAEKDRESSTGNDASRSIRTDLRTPGLEGWLQGFEFFRNIDSLLQLSMPDLSLKKFVFIAGGLFSTVFLIFFAFTMVFVVALVSAVLAGAIPFLYLTRKKHSRQRLLDDQLSDAMDFLGRALKAGHSLSTSLQMMGSELPEPIAGEFGRAFDQHSLGLPMEKVLKDMTRRVDSTDFAFFVTAVLIQRQTGGDLGEVLKNISGMIRQRIRLQQQVKAKTAEGRFTGYLLTAFPAVMFVVMYTLNKEYAGKLTNTTMGMQMLGAAFFMQVMGLFTIRKITQVKI